MKCLMMKPEYVGQILDGQKDIEYRTWSTNYRGEIFIACTATRYAKGYIAGVVTIKDCIYDDISEVYEWQLTNIKGVKPIPIKGRLRLFETGIDTYEVLHTEEDVIRAYSEAKESLLKKAGEKVV